MSEGQDLRSRYARMHEAGEHEVIKGCIHKTCHSLYFPSVIQIPIVPHCIEFRFARLSEQTPGLLAMTSLGRLTHTCGQRSGKPLIKHASK